MSSVLDASALIAILTGEPGAERAAAAAQSGTIAAVNLAEARDRLARSTRRLDAVEAAIDAIVAAGLRVLTCDRELAEQAADLRSAHYDRLRSPVSLADCFAIVAAASSGGPLVSSDVHQLRVAAAVGVAVHPIANSSGAVPEV